MKYSKSLLAISLAGVFFTGLTNAKPAVFFDDFDYQNIAEFNENGWKARTETGHPGIKGATWSAEG
ncbi:hypothetical protein [Shewanella waksmanii]|nr:hypothetical protein [Shewanella waksmanii]